MSWHWLVSSVVCVPGPWSPALPSPFTAPVFASANMRGELTTFASCGEASGTRITSIRNNEVFGSTSGLAPEHPASSAAGRTGAVPET